MANELRRALTGFPAVQEPRDISRAQQQTIINIRERLRQIEESLNIEVAGMTSVVQGATMPEAPADGNIYGRRNLAWNIVRSTGVKFFYQEDAPDTNTNNPGDEWFEPSTTILYTLIDDGSGRQWVELAGVGQGATRTGPLVIDVYDVVGNHTWAKAEGAYWIEGVVVGGGGAGGNGEINLFGDSGLPTWQSSGGAGGGGGGYVPFYGPASAFGSTEAVVVGAGGTRGTDVFGTTLWIGGNGTAGGTSSFAGIKAFGGAGGQGGRNSQTYGGGGAGAAAAGSTTLFVAADMGGTGPSTFNGNDNTYYIGGASGAGPGFASTGYIGGRATGGGQGGGGGGGTSRNTPYAGGAAYQFGKFDSPTISGGLNTGSNRNGSTASGIAVSLKGAGGGGGGGSTTGEGTPYANAGDGGNGQQPGGGGGGGGGVDQGSYVNGKGGYGGAGIVVVIQFRTTS